MTYQWYKNGNPIFGATSATYSILNVTVNDQAYYYVRITNAGGTVQSTTVTITVLAPPTVTSQPTNTTALSGQNAYFSVVAVGSGSLSYQWSFNGVAIPGATSSALWLNNIQTNNTGYYSATVANTYGTTPSSNATLAVFVPAGIATNPVTQTIVLGKPVSFSVVPSGTAPFHYQWRFNGNDIPLATNSTLTLPSVQTSDAGHYKVELYNPYGSTESTDARLTVLVPPSITTQPQSFTATPGQLVTFSVTAAGSGPLRYQWLFNGNALPGATSSSLTVAADNLATAGSYSVVITNLAGSVTSAVATLAVKPTPPTLGSAATASAGFSFQLAVPAGFTCIISASTNLQDWTPIATNFSATTNLVFTDPLSTNYPVRFYRAMLY
jgi:hypothetical protein